jgi:hypothetical protein
MFNDLPPEILHLIARNLSSSSLYHLMSSSRRLHAVFQRSLYTDVTLREGDSKDQIANIFLYAVTRTPWLASCVRSLRVMEWDPENANTETYTQKVGFDGTLVHELVSERRGYSDEERLEWLKDLECDNNDAWLALLIPQLKELQKLSLVWPDGSHHVVDMLQRAALEEEPIFPHLKEAYASWHDSENSFPSYYMDPFFKFPSMRKVGCDMLAEDENRDDDGFDAESDGSELPKRDTLPPRCSNITDIDLQYSNAGEGMREWVQACKALKSFRIVGGASVDTFYPRKFYESLSLQKSSLESIWVEPNDGAYIDVHDEWMGSFIDFTALKLVCASLPNIVGFNELNLPVRRLQDVLPSSLETLYLSLGFNGDANFDAAIDQLAELAISERFPRLAEIHLEYYDIGKPENVARFEWLEERCQGASVLCLPHVPTVRLESWSSHDWSRAVHDTITSGFSNIADRIVSLKSRR